MPNCKFCGTEIFWVKEGRKNKPIELDGGSHQCEEMKTSLKSFKKLTPNSLSPEEIARYEEQINKKKK